VKSLLSLKQKENENEKYYLINISFYHYTPKIIKILYNKKKKSNFGFGKVNCVLFLRKEKKILNKKGRDQRMNENEMKKNFKDYKKFPYQNHW
jgi:hypothetical protein